MICLRTRRSACKERRRCSSQKSRAWTRLPKSEEDVFYGPEELAGDLIKDFPAQAPIASKHANRKCRASKNQVGAAQSETELGVDSSQVHEDKGPVSSSSSCNNWRSKWEAVWPLPPLKKQDYFVGGETSGDYDLSN